jgi:hypothetical protein
LAIVISTVMSASVGSLQSSSARVPAQSASSPFSLKISTTSQIIRAGSSVNVNILVTNVSNHEIVIRYPYMEGFPVSWLLEVKSAEGAVPPPTAYGKELKAGSKIVNGRAVPLTGSNFSLSLRKGERLKVRLPVGDIYDLSRPGTYTIRVSHYDTETKDEVRSNTVSVTVETAAQYDEKFTHSAVPFQLAITVPEDTVKAGSDIPLSVHTTNVTGETLRFDATKLKIQVLDAQGNSAPWIGGPEWRRILEKGIGRRFSVGAFGAVDREFADLNGLYNLTKPGQYTIQVARFDVASKTWVKSNTITLTVMP